jgi:hypothetical protein
MAAAAAAVAVVAVAAAVVTACVWVGNQKEHHSGLC